jgi:hypothetical protein
MLCCWPCFERERDDREKVNDRGERERDDREKVSKCGERGEREF